MTLASRPVSLLMRPYSRALGDHRDLALFLAPEGWDHGQVGCSGSRPARPTACH